jgi:lipoate-protein ligase A
VETLRGECEKKIEGGKLVRVRIDFDRTINSIEITGDFFLHPEEALKDVEAALLGLDISDLEKATDKIKDVMDEKGIQVIGFSPHDITNIIKEVVR